MTTALAIILAVVTVAAAIGIIVLVAKLYAARAEADAGKLATGEAGEANATLVADRERLERVIAHLKAEVAELEKELDACNDPAFVRARLRRMLQANGGEGSGGPVPGPSTPAP